jgi:putative OPT family oligopeptide transporter
MAEQQKHFVPPEQQMTELSVKSLLLGMFLAVVLGAANAYLGLKAGMTVAATFPAAVIAMAVLKPLRGTILEENIARTTGAVGEALAAGAIFTLPAFIMTGVWTEFHYLEATSVVLVGGLLGVLFIIFLRRALVEDASLPFPESKATREIVVAGQGGQTGASYVLWAMVFSAVVELFNNGKGLKLIKTSVAWIWNIGKSSISYLDPSTSKLFAGTEAVKYDGKLYFATPNVSAALVGVGYIIGPRLAALTFAGGVLGWLFLMPLVLFLNKDLVAVQAATGKSFMTIAASAYNAQVKPIAVGAMLVGAFYTLYKMRSSLFEGVLRAFKPAAVGAAKDTRVDKDISYKLVAIGVLILLVPMFLIYWKFAEDLTAGLVATLVMGALGFLFAAVAGYLVGMIGSSSNPISGLTLSTLLIAAILMVAMGATGHKGIAAVLGVATVVCAIAGVAGDMIQDWKVGYMLGGTPWKMQLGGLLGVTAAGLTLVFVIALLQGDILNGSLPAPQAGLMAMMSKGIVAKQMSWSLVIVGMLFAIALILMGSPSPMLIAVGMYLPFPSTFAIFLGGAIKWFVESYLKKRNADKETMQLAENSGLLLASGLIAGEALMGVTIAGLFAAGVTLPKLGDSMILGFLLLGVFAFVLSYFPIKKALGEK